MAVDDPEQISEEEYRRWLTPKQALAYLPGIDTKANAQALINRLWLRHTRAAAESVVIVESGKEERHDFVFLPEIYWRSSPPKWPDDFWTTGDHYTLRESQSHAGYTINAQVYISLIGVRFDPEGVRKLREQLSGDPPAEDRIESATEAMSDRRNLPPLSDDLLNRWHVLFLRAYPKGTVTLATKSVEGMFPDRWVSRKRLRELFPDVQAGRPKKNNDLNNSPKTDGE